mgnify:CR=1 FL=1
MYNDTAYSNFKDKLPKKIKTQFEELFPSQNSIMQTFLKRTEWCHDLHKWQAERVYDKKRLTTFLARNQMDYSTFDILKKITSKPSFKEVKLKKPIKVRDTYYTKALSEPPQQNKKYIYLDFMEIYLEE